MVAHRRGDIERPQGNIFLLAEQIVESSANNSLEDTPGEKGRIPKHNQEIVPPGGGFAS